MQIKIKTKTNKTRAVYFSPINYLVDNYRRNGDLAMTQINYWRTKMRKYAKRNDAVGAHVQYQLNSLNAKLAKARKEIGKLKFQELETNAILAFCGGKPSPLIYSKAKGRFLK